MQNLLTDFQIILFNKVFQKFFVQKLQKFLTFFCWYLFVFSAVLLFIPFFFFVVFFNIFKICTFMHKILFLTAFATHPPTQFCTKEFYFIWAIKKFCSHEKASLECIHFFLFVHNTFYEKLYFFLLKKSQDFIVKLL